MCNLKINDTNELTKEKKRLTNLEDKLWLPGRKVGEKG